MRGNQKSVWVQVTLLVCALLVPGVALMPRTAGAQEQPAQPGGSAIEEGLYNCGKAKGPVSVSFKPDIELKDLLTWAMGYTCKNFVYSSSLATRGSKVTIIAPKKMSPQEAWKVFLTALNTMNYTVVPDGSVLRIVESATAKTEPLPIYRRNAPSSDSQLVRAVMRPAHISANDLSTALNAVKSKDGMVTVLDKSGVVLVTDYGNIISKMRTLLSEIDQALDGERLYMIRVNNANAAEIAGKLQEILGSTEKPAGPEAPQTTRRNRRTRNDDVAPVPEVEGNAGGGIPAIDEVETAVPSKIIPDERTNSLIVMATEPAYLRVLALVRRLDVAIGEAGDGRINVYYLENADAEELSQTLSAVISGVSQPSSGGTGNRQGGRSGRPAPAPGDSGGGGGTPAFEGQVRVTHDQPTNALVITASYKDFVALREVIRKLDTPRRQVFIEATILEVQTGNSLSLGTSFHAGAEVGDGDGIAIGGLQHGNLRSILPESLATQTGLLGGVLGPLLEGANEILGTSIPSYGILFQALATNNNVNVLSSPHILTTNNQEAEISVGQNIPYQSSYANLGGLGGAAGGFSLPVPSVQRQDVALKLKITPQINASDMVRLEIDQEISDIAQRNFEGLGPAWSKRTIKTTVVVRDQQTIVIGGLMSDRITVDETKIPLLGDLPLLGYLFKYNTRTKAKTNLLVLLTPYVVKDQMDVEQIVQRKVRERNEFVRSFSNFETMEYRPQIDYRRKRGLIEEINRTVSMIERDIEILRAESSRGDEFVEGLIEYDVKVEAGASGGESDSVEDAPPATEGAPAPGTGE